MKGNDMDSVRHYAWETVKFVVVCLILVFVIPTVIRGIMEWKPGFILVFGLIAGVMLGDYLAKHNVRRD